MPTIDENRKEWAKDSVWGSGGEDWSSAFGGSDMEYYSVILPRLHTFLPSGRILEIAPGFGRWTKYLIQQCNSFVGVDLEKKCVDACAVRFTRGLFIQNDGSNLAFIPDHSIDLIFSFDSLVHADNIILEKYLAQFERVLKKDGVAFLHHSNSLVYAEKGSRHFRDLTVSHQTVLGHCAKSGLWCNSQETFGWGGVEDEIDCISVITPLGSSMKRDYRYLSNRNFVKQIEEIKSLALLYGDTPLENAHA